MEKKFYIDDFEQLLKEKSDQFRMYPSKRVWHSIYNDLHPGRKWPSVAMSMFLVLTLLLVGYLNTSDNALTRQLADQTIASQNNNTNTEPPVSGNTKIKDHFPAGSENQFLFSLGSQSSSKTDIPKATETAGGSFVKNVNPNSNPVSSNAQTDPFRKKTFAVKVIYENNNNDLVQTLDNYIKTNQIFTDVAVVNKKNKKAKAVNPSAGNNTELDTDQSGFAGENSIGINKIGKESGGVNNISPAGLANSSALANKLNDPEILNKKDGNDALAAKNDLIKGDKSLSAEEKAWIEDFALRNKSKRSKWKGRTAIEFYVTPGVNYRTLTTNAQGSVTPFANTNINSSMSQKPGLGIETGVDLAYSLTKNLRLKAGVQFNYTNYGINADQATHPVLTSLLLNDVNTDYSYAATRTSTLSNPYNSSPLQPVTVHNSTYQVSIPVGLAYKLASTKKMEWFAGASIQATYAFGGKAYLISPDLNNYIYEPSAIRNWNLNTGFETYINYKLGAVSLQLGPQFRYQLFSTYRKNYAAIEKPYALGLKIGIVKGF